MTNAAIVVKFCSGTDAPAICEPILRSVPDWFALEEALLGYVRAAAEHPTAIAWAPASRDQREPIAAGFVTLHRHFDPAAEIHCMAVRPEYHRTGVGHTLVEFSEAWCRDHAVRFLQVKTLSPSRPCVFYDQTRKFYIAMGFVPLEEFPLLWGPANPCLQLIKAV